MATKRRSFRLNETQAEIVITCLQFFLDKTEHLPDIWGAHRRLADKLIDKLINYEWRTEE